MSRKEAFQGPSLGSGAGSLHGSLENLVRRLKDLFTPGARRPSMATIDFAASKAKRKLMRIPGVVAVFEVGKPGEPALEVMVETERDIGRVPSQIYGIRVRTVVGGTFHALASE